MALAYAEAHPERVSQILLRGSTSRRGRRRRAVPRRHRAHVSGPVAPPAGMRCRPPNGTPTSSRPTSGLLPRGRPRRPPSTPRWSGACGSRPRPTGRRRRAGPTIPDPAFALAFARLVTHYIRHDEFLEDGRVAPRRRCARRHPRHAGERPVRSAGADRECLGPSPGVAAGRARDRG